MVCVKKLWLIQFWEKRNIQLYISKFYPNIKREPSSCVDRNKKALTTSEYFCRLVGKCFRQLFISNINFEKILNIETLKVQLYCIFFDHINFSSFLRPYQFPLRSWTKIEINQWPFNHLEYSSPIVSQPSRKRRLSKYFSFLERMS